MACFIIAEIGVNHNGDMNLAKQLILSAKEAGADAVKFQTFVAEKLVTPHAKKAQYQLQNTAQEQSQLAMLKSLELSQAQHIELLDYCQSVNIQFLSTPFDHQSAEFLANDLALTQIKISSGDLTNAPLLYLVAKFGCQLIISTGMATMAEIKTALGVIALGALNRNEEWLPPTYDNFIKAFESAEGQKQLKQNVSILHCTTDYPAQPEELNLKVLQAYKETFKLPIGYSDHSLGQQASCSAVALGATIIEKHITLDQNLPGPDHKASIEPEDFKRFIKAIREVEVLLGQSIKQPTRSEKKNIPIARKSLVANTHIQKGQTFSIENLACKRPGDGMSPIHFWGLLNQVASRDYQSGDLIDEQ